MLWLVLRFKTGLGIDVRFLDDLHGLIAAIKVTVVIIVRVLLICYERLADDS